MPAAPQPLGYLGLVLHAHLPYVRHPEYEVCQEERWLFEAISECYIPLLRMCRRLWEEGIPFRFALSLSPPLLHMLQDPLLQQRYREHLRQLIDLSQQEVRRRRGDPARQRLARWYRRGYRNCLALFDACQGDLVGEWAKLAQAGCLELLTSSATHAFLPLLRQQPWAVRAQLHIAAQQHRRVFGTPARGVWLPECGYYPGLEQAVAEAGFEYFILDSHGVLHAAEQPRHGVFAPLACPNGVAAFGRDPAAAQQVWSAQGGYPGDVDYREFHRDLGFELEASQVPDYFRLDGQALGTGLKYHRVTGPGAAKQLYQPRQAARKARLHAEDFCARQRQQLSLQAAEMSLPPLALAPYDAELFGHWWLEGPLWLEYLARALPGSGLQWLTPGDYLRRHGTAQTTQPSASSWGEQGYNNYWLDADSAWIYPLLHRAGEQMRELARRFERPDALQRRALAQAARCLLLAQASDWAFILRSGSVVEYARRRIHNHLARFDYLYQALSGAGVDPQRLAALEYLDNIFPELDYRWFA